MAAVGSVLSKDVADVLRSVAGGAALPDTAFQAVTTCVFQVLAREEGVTEEDLYELESLSSLPPAVPKTLFSALATLVLESVKRGMSAAAVGAALQEVGVEEARVAAFGKMFTSYEEKIGAVLSQTAIGIPTIVDVEWRLDYHVNSSATGRHHDPLFIVKLKTRQDDGTLKDVEFTCTRAQLSDLLQQARSAKQSVDKLIGVSGKK